MIDLNEAEKQALDFASRALQGELPSARTSAKIRQFVDAAVTMAGMTKPGFSVNAEALIAELEHATSVLTERPAVLTDGRVQPWWIERKGQIEPMRFWRRYRRYLEQEKNMRDKDLDSVDEQTDAILDRIQNPAISGAWDVRGMVVGSVQSGKTANYVGVTTKALDAGYKVIIILAGIHNNLRAQTQERVDEGILGFDSQRRLDPDRVDYKLGVGKLLNTSDLGPPTSITPLTNSADNGDFTTGAQRVNVSLAGGPVIMVVKKNVTPLKHILSWLEVAGGQLGHQNADERISAIPLLMIDDEADNASINTKDRPGVPDEETNITKINRLIRLILNRFEQSSYVGYTATPFANIFINPEAERDEEGKDLFPRDFIVNVRPSSRYVGPSKVFGYSRDLEAGIDEVHPLPVFREVEDHELYFPPKHKQEHRPDSLPGSLNRAILCFVLSCAARRARGQRAVHNSMLIHVTRFISVQKHVKELVEDEFGRVKRAITYDKADHPVWAALHELWHTDFVPTSQSIRAVESDKRLTELGWEEVKAELPVAVGKIVVKEIHGQSREALDYSRQKDGVSVIAVGGNKLSRGLTLEGLSVSYFLRSTKMYDTLMQMGRWFGYRDGYLDLCRLYTTDELRDWFSHVALAEEELKREFDHMVDARLTPSDYGLRVRQHPDGMMITALNKMAHGQSREVTFAGQLVQTAFFERNSARQRKNVKAVEDWLCTLPAFRVLEDGHHRRTANRAQVADFLDKILAPGFIHPKCSRFGPELQSFVQEQEENGGLQEWTVILPKGGGHEKEIAGHKINLTRRSDVTEGHGYYSLSKANVQEPKHEMLDLDEIELTEELAVEILAKLEVRDAGAGAMPLIKPGGEADAVRGCIGQKLSKAVHALAAVRNKQTIGSMRDEMRQLRPAAKGLLIIYPLDTSNVTGLEDVSYVPAFALSFPATHKARRVLYKVNPVWIRKHLTQFNLEDTADEADW
ncbi:MAG: Z1 domain-containing protein [Prosthecobacter sp.]|jgi:hypothetical protein|uniref:Z1 domain-containing protein n=1 Tax=Prosthecobacter sp. TaxID=1965333 RepID=UPI0019F9EAFC|nr:Z1 domain-containing protein [Prosthecobacter sp.]MBE2284612.1 Z1 domain-containing protein [Prosthecobacter sp.]